MRRSALAPALLSLIAGVSYAGGVAAEPAKNLNSVPEDNLGVVAAAGPDNKFIRQIVSGRPNEDLVICVAGCFSGRDRVVYAQPADKPELRPVTVRVTEPDTASPSETPAKADKALGPSASNDAKPAAGSSTPGMTAAAPSFDPRSPVILNGASDGTSGVGSDKSAGALGPSHPTN